MAKAGPVAMRVGGRGPLAVALITLAAIPLGIALTENKTQGIISPLEDVPWPGTGWPPGGVGWCAAGTRSYALEALVISCGGELCVTLVRYWSFLPGGAPGTGGRSVVVEALGLRAEVPLVRSGMYDETPTVLVVSAPGEISVAGREDLSVDVPGCAGGAPRSPAALRLGDPSGVDSERTLWEGGGLSVILVDSAGRVTAGGLDLKPGRYLVVVPGG